MTGSAICFSSTLQSNFSLKAASKYLFAGVQIKVSFLPPRLLSCTSDSSAGFSPDLESKGMVWEEITSVKGERERVAIYLLVSEV